MKVKDIDDLDENWQKNVPYQHKNVCINWRFQVQPFVYST